MAEVTDPANVNTSMDSRAECSAKDTVKRQQQHTIHTTPGSLPENSNKLSNAARGLLMRLLDRDPKVRLRNLRQLQQTAFFLGFNFDHVKTKKISPKYVLEQHCANYNLNTSFNNKQEFLEFNQNVTV